MKKRKTGPEPIHNWPALHKEWEKSPLSLRAFTEQKAISYTYASKEFTKIDKEQNEEALTKTRHLLAQALPDFAKGLIELAQDEDKNIKLKAITSGLDRSGFSPQSVALQVNNVTNTQVLIAPIFAGQGEIIENSFLGSKNADTESND